MLDGGAQDFCTHTTVVTSNGWYTHWRHILAPFIVKQCFRFLENYFDVIWKVCEGRKISCRFGWFDCHCFAFVVVFRFFFFTIHIEWKQQQVKKQRQNYRKNYEQNFTHCEVETCTEKAQGKVSFLVEIAIGIVKFYGIFMTLFSLFFPHCNIPLFHLPRATAVWDGNSMAIIVQVFIVVCISMNLFDFKFCGKNINSARKR